MEKSKSLVLLDIKPRKSKIRISQNEKPKSNVIHFLPSIKFRYNKIHCLIKKNIKNFPLNIKNFPSNIKQKSYVLLRFYPNAPGTEASRRPGEAGAAAFSKKAYVILLHAT